MDIAFLSPIFFFFLNRLQLTHHSFSYTHSFANTTSQILTIQHNNLEASLVMKLSVIGFHNVLDVVQQSTYWYSQLLIVQLDVNYQIFLIARFSNNHHFDHSTIKFPVTCWSPWFSCLIFQSLDMVAQHSWLFNLEIISLNEIVSFHVVSTTFT